MATCENCGNPFQGRDGARYCGPPCRQRAYRSRSKVKAEHRTDGTLGPCGWLGEHGGCKEPATWEVRKQCNAGAHPGPWETARICEDHLAAYLGGYETVAVASGYASVVPRA